MLLILEGPDCVGKTTLAVQLTKRLERAGYAVELRHCGPPTQHPLNEYELPLFDYRPGGNRAIIYDRHFWGELVYPELFGRATQLTPAIRLHIELFLMSRGAQLISVTAPTERIQRCISCRGDELVKPEVVSRMNYLFSRRLVDSLLPYTAIDGFEIDNDDVWAIMESADAQARRAARIRNYVTYVGSSRPRVLLVGDQRHNVRLGTGDLRPAFLPYPATSGNYLLEALASRLGRFDLARVGIANACDDDDITQLWHDLNRPALVIMGKRAERATRDLVKYAWENGTKCVIVEHPQYRRRFLHAQAADYVRDITSVMDLLEEQPWS